MALPTLRIVAFFTLVGGCEAGITASGTIEAPADVRALVSRTTPGYLSVRVDYGKSMQVRPLGIFCELPASIPFHIDEFGCVDAARATVTAPLHAVPAGRLPPNWSCDDRHPDVPIDNTAPLLAEAKQEVPIDRSSGACDSGSLRANLTLVVVKKSPR